MMLSIIIVNYKTPQLVVDCLHTVFNEKFNFQLEIIIVDNASGDSSRQIVTSAFPDIRWVQMDYNAGFARANNAGISQAKGEIVLLLNSDTLNKYNVIGKCCETFYLSQYAACGVQLINPDGSPQISGNFVITGGLNNLLPLPYVGKALKFLAQSINIKKTNVPDSDDETEVDWINGAFLMVKKETIEKAGLLDTDFFLYAEEAEWCGRIKKIGKLCIYGQYKIIHLQGETANQTFGSSGRGYYNLYDKKGLQIMLSNFLRIRKQFGLSWFIIQMAFYTLTIPVFLTGAFLQNIITLKNPLKSLVLWVGFTVNVLKLWKFAPRIITNSPYFYKVL
ncbi:MAG: glycosyltransferase [Agriterribacter sp.]